MVSTQNKMNEVNMEPIYDYYEKYSLVPMGGTRSIWCMQIAYIGLCFFMSGLVPSYVFDSLHISWVFNTASKVLLEVLNIQITTLRRSKSTLFPFELYLVY